MSDARTQGYGWREIATTAAEAVGSRPRLVTLPGLAWRAAGSVSEAAARLARRTPMLSRGKVSEMLHGDWSVAAARQAPRHLWQPQVDLTRGFEETVAWYRQCGWLPRL